MPGKTIRASSKAYSTSRGATGSDRCCTERPHTAQIHCASSRTAIATNLQCNGDRPKPVNGLRFDPSLGHLVLNGGLQSLASAAEKPLSVSFARQVSRTDGYVLGRSRLFPVPMGIQSNSIWIRSDDEATGFLVVFT